jgi:DNA-binding response OmpR family regulator
MHSPSKWDLAQSQNPDDQWLVVSVTDTGRGIQPDELPQVFEKFKQTGDTLTDRSRGTGLGLTICKEIIEHHGGVIWVQSHPDAGSIFSYALPVYNIEETETEQPGLDEARPVTPLAEVRQWVSEALAPLAPPSDGVAQPPLILVVDDDPNIRELLRQELSGAGYRVAQAADGVEALAQARKKKPDLIVLDVMMPGVSGFDVTSALKADERTADTPILILSIVEDRERGLQLGADDYLTKPVDSDRLLSAIADLLNSDADQRERKVLVADGDASVVEAITRVLRQRGFQVVEAYDSHDTIRKAQTEQPDLVILDAVLSTMDDCAVLKALRYQNQEQQTNIIVMATDKNQDMAE